MSTIADYEKVKEHIVELARQAAVDKDFELLDWYRTVWEACNKIIKKKQQENLPVFPVTPVHVADMLTVLRQQVFEWLCEDSEQSWEIANLFVRDAGPELLNTLGIKDVYIFYEDDEQE